MGFNFLKNQRGWIEELVICRELKPQGEDVGAVGEERDMEMDCEEVERLQAIFLGLRHHMRSSAWCDWILRHAIHQLPQSRARSPTPQQCSPRFPRMFQFHPFFFFLFFFLLGFSAFVLPFIDILVGMNYDKVFCFSLHNPISGFYASDYLWLLGFWFWGFRLLIVFVIWLSATFD